MIATAIGGVEFDVLLAEDVFGGEQVGAIGIAAECDHVRMFAEQQDVFDGVSFTCDDQALLEGVGIGVGDEVVEVGDKEVGHCVTRDGVGVLAS